MAVEKNNVVVVEHEFAASVSRVFDAIKAGRLFFNCGAWAEDTKVDFRVGGKYKANWGHHGSTTGEFTEIVENKRVAFTWNFAEAEVKSRVTIDLVAQGNGCKAKLRHEGFDSHEAAESHEGGWVGGLDGLGGELTKGRLRFEREFLASQEMLYEACAGLNFFSNMGATPTNSKIDFRVGGSYSCKLDNGNTIHGKFLEIEKNKKIVFTWEASPCGASLEKTTKVSMEFGPWGDGGKNSYIELIHEGLPDSESACSHHAGWNSVLRKIYDRAQR